jgi:hypothetical protein
MAFLLVELRELVKEFDEMGGSGVLEAPVLIGQRSVPSAVPR